jgi:uncharacterized protein (TIGR00369 family)
MPGRSARIGKVLYALYPNLNVGSRGMKEKAKLTGPEIERLLTTEFPQMFNPQGGFAIDEVWFRGCRVRKRFDPQSLRPGGTIAGTTMMALADLGPYIAIHASIGWSPMAVTTNLSINFLKRPAQKDLLAETRLIKLGKRLAVADIAIRSEGEDELVAHAISTYSIPSSVK